ncbi:PRC-barrel domain-containing protein [Rhodobacteraceae bacterium]|nr:PRC-barrel domain-containing protein [Paracoccaceae bacterium]
MKNSLISATLISGLAVGAAGATGLLGGETSASASVGVGGGGASASANVGSGAATASAGLGGGTSGAGASVNVGFGSNTSTASNSASVGQDGLAVEQDDESILATSYLIGKPLITSDGVVLGTITDIRQSGAGCPAFEIAPSRSLAVDHSKVLVKSNGCAMGASSVRVSMASKFFISKTR